MVEADFFSEGRRILVVGAGRSGMAALRLLAGLGCGLTISDNGAHSALADADRQWLADHDVTLEFGGHQPQTFLAAEAIVVSPGVPLEQPALAAAARAGIPMIGELELGALFSYLPIIAVTGTNGKTTVTTMIGELLKAAGRRVFVGGNIGTPLCAFVADQGVADVLVLEVSSFQLDSAVAFRPHIALLLNISPDHLDRYVSYDAYAAAKMKIFSRQRRDDFAVINADDPLIKGRMAAIPSTIREFGRTQSSHARLEKGRAVLRLPAGTMEEYELPTALSASPNSDNCLAAITAVRLLGCPAEAVARGLAAFKPLAHRLTPVATVKGVEYIDDSKATNIGALQSALAGLHRPVHLIAGGRDKGGDYGLIAKEIEATVKTVVVIGEAADKISAAWGELVPVMRARSMEEAVALAAGSARAGEVVLLSPACASFDMFSGYVERGRVFQAAVAALPPQPPGDEALATPPSPGQARFKAGKATSCDL
jgi:UDP-N-acetylmuramoylalanine--D-glutamate ligase